MPVFLKNVRKICWEHCCSALPFTSVFIMRKKWSASRSSVMKNFCRSSAIRRSVPQRRRLILNLKSFPQTPTSPLSMNIYTGTKYILLRLKKAAEDALAYARENKNFRQNEETLLGTLHTIQGYLGEISISEMLDTYVNWLNGADPTQYDWMNVENNLLPVLYTFWLCEARPEWTDTCRLFLLEGQRKSFEYIKNSRDKGAYECMQRFTSYIMNSYIELDSGIPFRHYYEKFARSLFNEEFDLIRLPRCGNRFRRTRLQLQQKFCRYARRSPLQRRPYVQPGSRTALCFQDFLPSSHQQNNTLMRIT